MEILKKKIILVIVLMIVVSGVSVYATSTYLASQVTYKDETSVADALNDLYTKTNKEILNKLTLKIRSESYSSSDAGCTNYNFDAIPSIINNYDYLKITSLDTNNVKKYEIKGYSRTSSSSINLELNKEYNLSDISNIWVVVWSNTTGQMSYAIPTVELYNKE